MDALGGFLLCVILFGVVLHALRAWWEQRRGALVKAGLHLQWAVLMVLLAILSEVLV